MNKLLIPALRQYMHNDGSGLIHGYDAKVTDEIVKGLQDKIKELEALLIVEKFNKEYFRDQAEQQASK